VSFPRPDLDVVRTVNTERSGVCPPGWGRRPPQRKVPCRRGLWSSRPAGGHERYPSGRGPRGRDALANSGRCRSAPHRARWLHKAVVVRQACD
jgi:hypothetical protein